MRNSLRHYREQKGWTLREAEQHLGFSFQLIQAYETRLAPSKEFLKKTSKVYGVSEEELLKSRELKEAPAPYRAGLAYELMKEGELIEMIEKKLSEAKEAHGERREKLFHAVSDMTAEMARLAKESGGRPPPADGLEAAERDVRRVVEESRRPVASDSERSRDAQRRSSGGKES